MVLFGCEVAYQKALATHSQVGLGCSPHNGNDIPIEPTAEQQQQPVCYTPKTTLPDQGKKKIAKYNPNDSMPETPRHICAGSHVNWGLLHMRTIDNYRSGGFSLMDPHYRSPFRGHISFLLGRKKRSTDDDLHSSTFHPTLQNSLFSSFTVTCRNTHSLRNY